MSYTAAQGWLPLGPVSYQQGGGGTNLRNHSGAGLNKKGAAEAAPLVSMSVRTVQFLKRTDT